MKTTLIFRLAVGLLCFITSSGSFAQAGAAPALPGYWNVETNLTTRDYTIVRFYNQQDQLVYQERLDNHCLDVTKNTSKCRRTSRKLTATLQLVLREPSTYASNTLLAQQFDSKRRSQRAYAVR